MPRLSPLLIAAVLVVAAVWALDAYTHLAPPPAELAGELGSANGTPLDSVSAYRENSIRGPPAVDPAAYRLAVGGAVGRPLNYSYGEVLEKFPHESRVVTLSCVEGWDATSLFEGVAVIDLLAASDPSPDATTVVFSALDGYTTSLPLAAVRDRRLLLAHRLTKPNHPWTNGQVERMNRTIKEATVKRFHYESHDQLRTHLADFMAAYNFARRLKTLSGLTPYEYIAKIWTSEPDRFIVDPIHQMPGLNT